MLVYIQTHFMPSRTCRCLQPEQVHPVDPGLQVHCPVTGSQGIGSEPYGSHSHSWQDPPGVLGSPAYPEEHLDIKHMNPELVY